MRFLGNIEAKVDTKHRVFVPVTFRRQLEAAENMPVQLYLRKDIYQDCIVVYPASVWETELSTLRTKLNKWIPEEQELYRQFMLEAESVEMDANGRILISRRLLNLVGIDTEVSFLGVDDTMEIWPKQALETPRVETEEFKRKMQELMGKKE